MKVTTKEVNGVEVKELEYTEEEKEILEKVQKEFL